MVVSSERECGALEHPEGGASGSGGGCADPYRKIFRSRERDDVEGTSSGQLFALELSEAATSAVTSSRRAAGDGASCPPREPASAAREGARISAAALPADRDASPETMQLP